MEQTTASDQTTEKPKKSILYTRTGDEGTSSLYNGERKKKNDARFKSLGSIDELNAALGISRHYCEKAGNGLDAQLFQVQCLLFDVGSNIATPRETAKERLIASTGFDEDGCILSELEEWVDAHDARVPPLRNFILPGGCESAVFLHQARTICRRAERDLVELNEESAVDSSVLKYINRLSDYLFVATRIANQFEAQDETIYQKQRGTRTRSLVDNK